MDIFRKIILTTAMAGAGCLCLHSETTEFTYTYADGELTSYGTSRKETVDVAMCIDNAALTGFKVTEVKAYVNANGDGVSAASLWMTKELRLEKKVNSPDLWSVPVEVENGEYADPIDGKEYSVGVLEYKLETPYELTGDPVYVGYSLTIDNIDEEQLRQPVLLSKVDNIDGFFLHSNKTVIHWTNYSEKTKSAAVIVLTLEKEASDASLGIKAIPTAYVAENEDFQAEVVVTNTGISPVETISYRYVPDNGSVAKDAVLELNEPIVPDLARPSTISLKIDGMTGLGDHEFPIEIIEVNGKPNTSLAKERDMRITIVPFFPKHRPLIEEYTGLWCKFCIRGYIGMELIKERYEDDQVSICYHNNDAMMVTSDYPMDIPGYPSASIDRNEAIDPYYGTHKDIDFGIRKNLDSSISELALAAIDVAAEADGKKVSVESTVRFITDVTDGNYRIGYVLTRDGMSNPQWLQSNAYAGADGLEGTYLEQAALWPAYVSGLVFNDVAIDVTGMMGVTGSLPERMDMGEPYTHSYSFDLEYNKMAEDLQDLSIAAFIIDKNTGKIVNANKVGLSDPDGVNAIPSSSEVVATSYYDMMGRQISSPIEGMYIQVDKLSDGTITSTKVSR